MKCNKSETAIANLAPEQFRVTQENGTERPYTCHFPRADWVLSKREAAE